MAGLLDYYNQNPELFAQNESLLAQDPAYNLGLMNLEAMNLKEIEGGEPLTGFRKYATKFGNMLAGESDKPLVSNITSPFGEYIPDTGEINIYGGKFTKDDVPTMWTEEAPMYNIDKARTIAHENRHLLTENYPELHAAQPTWSTLDDENIYGSFAAKADETSAHWRNEAFNRFMDLQNFPELGFRTPMSKMYPRGLSAINLKPTDIYFDKIWRDKWTPHVKDYNKTLETIAQNTQKPPQINQGGGNGGYQGGGGKPGSMPTGTAGRNPWGRADGGLINLYRNGGFI